MRYLLPLKEYVAYCDALRLVQWRCPLTFSDSLSRTVVRRQEMLQKYVEKCEEILSTKSEAKENLAKEVVTLLILS